MLNALTKKVRTEKIPIGPDYAEEMERSREFMKRDNHLTPEGVGPTTAWRGEAIKKSTTLAEEGKKLLDAGDKDAATKKYIEAIEVLGEPKKPAAKEAAPSDGLGVLTMPKSAGLV